MNVGKEKQQYKAINVTEEVHTELKAFTEKCGISMSSFVRAACRNYYETVEDILGIKDDIVKDDD